MRKVFLLFFVLLIGTTLLAETTPIKGTNSVDRAPLTTVDVTFSVDMSNYGNTFTTVYISGEMNGWSGTANPLVSQGNGIYSTTLTLTENTSYWYKYQVDGWASQEGFASTDACASNNNGNFDRTYATGTMNASLPLYCWNSCNTCGIAPPVLLKPVLPITFQDTVTINYALTDFGNNLSWMMVDPTDPNNTVVRSQKTAGSQPWAGTTVGENGFATAIPFTATDTKMSVRVWSPDANTTIRLKVEEAGVPTISVETEAVTTLAGQWETLEFDFSNEATGTAALNLANTYTKASMFFDFNVAGTGKVYYWDDVMMAAPVVSTPDSVDITFLVNTANIPTVDPTGIFIAGGGNFGNPGDNAMTDANNDGVWEVTVRKPKGFTSDYTFTNGDSGWGAKENISGQSCAVAPYDDRNLPGVWSDTTLLTCFGSCVSDTVCPAPPATIDLTFNLDLSQYGTAFTTAYVAGNFNGWNGTSNPLTDQGNGLWSGMITVNENDSIEYNFRADGVEETLTVGASCTKTSGPFTNRFIAFGNMDMVIPVVCFESCAACLTAPSDSVNVTFQVDMALETTNTGGVFLGADFENFNGSIAMTDTDGDDIWETTVMLPKNASYEFKYINGPNWVTSENFDPIQDSLCTITTGNVTNRIVGIGASDTATAAYCYNYCIDCQSVSVNDVSLTAAFEMMPNPANNFVRLAFNDEFMSIEKTITVFNSVGQEVFNNITNHVNTYEINTAAFAKGMYFITVQTEEGVQTKRLVIIH